MAVVSGGSNGNLDAVPPSVRPVVSTLIESQPVPTLLIGPTGAPVTNRSAEQFVTDTRNGQRVVTHDGTDLWTIIEARADEASPFLDVHTRLRTAEGAAAEAVLSVMPIRGAGGALSSAAVFVLALPGERLNSADLRAVEGMHAMVERLGGLLGAARVIMLEFDEDAPLEARMCGYWSADGEAPPTSAMPLASAPAGAFAGKRVLVIPSGLKAAFPDAPRVGDHESYAGVMLTNYQGGPIGILAATWRQPIVDVAGVTAVLSIAGQRASQALSEAMARNELRESEQRYGAVFEGSGVPILLIEPITTQVVDANPAACAYYGFPRDEFVTMSFLQLDTTGAESVHAELQRAVQGSRDKFVGEHLLSSGRVRDVEVSVGPVRVAGRNLLYCIVNDFTERKHMEAALERRKHSLERVVGQRTEDLLRANEDLQHASMSRDVVLGNLAQELRTSLQTITGFSELLLEGIAGGLTGEQRRQVEMVQQAGSRLSAFASTLVELQLAEAERLPQSEEFDLVSLVESVVTGLDSFADDKGLALTFVAEKGPVMVHTDRYKVQQILLNLLSNAIRYTKEGAITAAVSGRDGRVRVSVSDTGVGIEPEALGTLFDAPETAAGKAGIGLPASRRIASAIGATIEVESTPGTGSTFSLSLPCHEGWEHDNAGAEG